MNEIRPILGCVLGSQRGLDRFTALLVTEIAQAHERFSSSGRQSHQLLVVEGMNRVGFADVEFEASGRIGWVSWKLDLDMLIAASNLQQKAGHHNVCAMRDVVDAYCVLAGEIALQRRHKIGH